MDKFALVMRITSYIAVALHDGSRADLVTAMQSAAERFQLVVAMHEAEESTFPESYAAFDSSTRRFPNEQGLTQAITSVKCAWLEYNFPLAFSDHVKKQALAFSRIRSILNASVCQRLKQEQFLNRILREDLHHCLLQDLEAIMKEMFVRNTVSQSSIERLWTVTVHQHQTTMPAFLNLIRNLAKDWPPMFDSLLFNSILNEKLFPTGVIEFIGKFQWRNLLVEQNDLCFRLLREVYKSEPSPPLIETMTRFIPKGAEFQRLRDECCGMLEDAANRDLGLAILQITCQTLDAKTLTSMLALVVNQEPNLDIIRRIILQRKRILTSDEITRLVPITMPRFETDSQRVSEFYYELLARPDIFTPGQIQELFPQIITVCTFSNAFFQLLRLFLHKMNEHVQLPGVGLEGLWRFYFRTGEPRIVELIIRWYVQGPSREVAAAYLQALFDHFETPNALRAIVKFIDYTESGIAVTNRFLRESDLFELEFSGDYEAKVKTFKDASYDRVAGIIATGTKRTNFSLMLGHEEIDSSNFRLGNFRVTFQNGGERAPAVSQTLSSLLFSSAHCTSRLMRCLCSSNEEIASEAFRVFNLLPSRVPFPRTNWESFFRHDRKYEALYYLHGLGNLLANKDPGIFESNGAVCLLEFALLDAPKLFTEPEHILLALTVCELLTTFEQWKSMKRVPFDFQSLAQTIINATDPEVMAIQLRLFSECSDTGISINPELVRRCLLSEANSVRCFGLSFLQRLSVSEQESVLFSSLAESIHKRQNSKDLFQCLWSITDKVDAVQMWAQLTDVLIRNFSKPRTDSSLERLRYKSPPLDSLTEIFKILNSLSIPLEIPNSDDLFSFLVHEILFSDSVYYEPPLCFYQLLSRLIEEKKERIEPIFKQIRRILCFHDKQTTPFMMNCVCARFY